MDTPNQPEQDQFNQLLLDSLSPIEPGTEQSRRLKDDLLGRVSQSIAKHSGVLTIRSKEGVWQKLKDGIRVKQLWCGAQQGNSVLIEFAPGASLMPHRHNCLEEGIVLRGDLQMGDLRLGPLDYHASPAGSRHGGISSQHGALAYLRGTSLGNTQALLLEVLGGLLPFGQDRSLTVYANNHDTWQKVAPGVWKKSLWHDGASESCFYRLDADTRFPERVYQGEQEFMMLDGDLFVDDVLLRVGDYQLGPPGRIHPDIYTDVGATVFVRGGR